MSSSKRLLFWCGLVIGLAGSAAMAAPGRMKGIVTDAAGNPLEGVTITIRSAEFNYEKVTTTKKNGSFSLAVTEGSHPYVIQLEKNGYQTVEEPFRFAYGEVVNGAWVLSSVDEAASQADQLQALEASDKATKAYNLGVEAYNAGDREAAIEQFRAAVAANPDFQLAYVSLARLFLETEQWTEARLAAESFLAIRPEDPVGLEMLYDAYWGGGDSDKADETLQKMLALGAGPAAAARIFNQAVAATKKQDYQAAERGFAKALELDPELYQALLPLAQIHFSRQEWQPAIDKAEAYLKHDAANARANMVRYLSYRELGQSEVAEAAFAEIQKTSPQAAAELFLRDGTNFYNDGRVAEATAAVETSLALDGTNPQAYYQLGLCYVSAGKNSAAKEKLEKFLELAPDDPEAASVREMLTYLK